MIQATIVLTAAGLISTFLYKNQHGKRKFKKIPINDWISLVFLPIVIYVWWAFVVKSILSRPYTPIINVSDIDLMLITFGVIAVGAVGNTIHSTGKILWYHLEPKKDVVKSAYLINEIFHGPLGHYIVFICGLLIIFLMPVLEINHPIEQALKPHEMRILAFSGILFGISIKRCFSFTSRWFGGYNKILFVYTTILTALTASLYHFFDMYFYLYPITWFAVWIFAAIIGTFSIQTLLWFIKKRRKPETLYDKIMKMPFGKQLIRIKSMLGI